MKCFLKMNSVTILWCNNNNSYILCAINLHAHVFLPLHVLVSLYKISNPNIASCAEEVARVKGYPFQSTCGELFFFPTLSSALSPSTTPVFQSCNFIYLLCITVKYTKYSRHITTEVKLGTREVVNIIPSIFFNFPNPYESSVFSPICVCSER